MKEANWLSSGTSAKRTVRSTGTAATAYGVSVGTSSCANRVPAVRPVESNVHVTGSVAPAATVPEAGSSDSQGMSWNAQTFVSSVSTS
jgi:hypothetical protein